jgi:hypothetical protein
MSTGCYMMGLHSVTWGLIFIAIGILGLILNYWLDKKYNDICVGSMCGSLVVIWLGAMLALKI